MLILQAVSDLMISSRDSKTALYFTEKGWNKIFHLEASFPEAENKKDDKRNELHTSPYIRAHGPPPREVVSHSRHVQTTIT